jgi:hypothetical protein
VSKTSTAKQGKKGKKGKGKASLVQNYDGKHNIN